MKLRTQFSLFSALLISSVVAGIAGGFYWKEKARIKHDFQEERFSIVRKLESSSLEAIISKDYQALIHYLKDLKKEHPEMLWAGVHHAGELVAHTENQWIGKTPADANTLKAISSPQITEISYWLDNIEILEVASPIRSGTARIGTARVAFSQKALSEKLNLTLIATLKRIIQIALTMLVPGIALALFMAKNMTYRISRLVMGARSFAKGNFQEQISLKGSDEIQELSSEFNLMANQLSKLYGKVHEQADTLAKTNIELLEMDKIKKNFFSLVSHELRGPLTTVQGYLTMLLEAQGMEDWKKQERYIMIIREETGRIAKMVNEFMDLSRIESGTFQIEMSPIDAKTLVDFVVNRALPEAESQRINFSWQLDESVRSFTGDPDRIAQVLMNLIGNSLKFTLPGDSIRLEVSTIPKGRRADDTEQIMFKVRDSGKGVPRESLEKIFGRYYQIEGEEKKKGLGLGLAFAKEVVERHGGTIWAESEGTGKGSAFIFVLPVNSKKQTS